MDRARRAAAPARRKPLPGSASPSSASEAPTDPPPPPSSPLVTHPPAASTPHTAPQSRRGSKAAQQPFAFSAPGPNTKKRSRTTDAFGFGYADGDFADHGSPNKGGHSLRKRARVDYTLEHIDDEVMVPNSTMAASSTRGKKRKSDLMDPAEHPYGPSPAKKRGDSLGSDGPSSLRRNPARKTAETKVYDEDEDVKDVIEVGLSYSDAHESDPPRASHSGESSAAHSPEAPSKLPAAAAEPDTKALQSTRSPDDKADASAQGSGLAPASETNHQPLQAQTEAVQSPTPEARPVPHSVAAVVDSMSSAETSLPALSATQEPIEPTTTTETQPSSAADADDDPKVHEQTNVHDTAENELVPTPVTQEDHSSANDLAPEPSVFDTMDRRGDQNVAATAATVEEATQSETATAAPVSEDAPATEGAAHDGEQPRSPHQEPGETTTSIDHDAKEGTTPVPEPPRITVSDASQPSDVPNMSLPAEQVAETISGSAATHDSPPDDASASRQASPQPADEDAARGDSATGIATLADQDRPWANLSPYLPHEYDMYPARRDAPKDGSGAAQISENKEKVNKSTPLVENPTSPGDEASGETGNPLADPSSMAALDTSAGDSPAVESTEPTAANSPAAAAADENGTDANVMESQAAPSKPTFYRYRRMRSPADFAAALQDYEKMPTDELYELLDVINAAMQEWQHEYQHSINVVADWENASRRKEADTKYENKTRDLDSKAINHVEPEFTVKGYKARQKDVENLEETRWLQSQDRIMAASYFFSYDPHPSKIGRQDLDNCIEEGVKTRSRSLRNQPKQTAKASEADEVTNKRTRKPVQPFDPASQQASRGGTPASSMTGRKKQANKAANGEAPKGSSGKAPAEFTSDAEESPQQKGRRRGRGNAGAKEASFNTTEGSSPPSADAVSSHDGSFAKPGRPRAKKASRLAEQAFDDDVEARPAKQRKSHVLTLKIPKSNNLSEPSSAITDNGDSRPSTASSDSTSHTAESSYSFRPKRQKRFRDEPDDDDEVSDQQPPKKKGKRVASRKDATAKEGVVGSKAQDAVPAADGGAAPGGRKIPKIKVISKTALSRNSTPASQAAASAAGEADERPKDYKSMTKSEKMSASMKSRWANGNMAGAVEKRKATLAAKKAAQAAADNKAGPIAPKPPKIRATKKEQTAREEQQQKQSAGFIQHGIPGAGSASTANH